jgi:hypothetical protein
VSVKSEQAAGITTMNQLKAATTLVLCLATAVCVRPMPDVSATPCAPIPSRWVDLPEAPFIAQLREGVPVLVTRSKQTFSQIKVGCVVERDGKAHVVGELLGQHIFHGTFGPNYPVTDLLFTLSNQDLYRHLSGSERCTPDSFFAVTAAVPVSANGAEGSTWKAEGTAWAGDVSCSGVSRLTGFAGRSPFSEFDAGGVRGFGYGTESSGSLSPADAKFGSQPARACTPG